MTREEAIADIRDNIKPVVGGKSLDMAIKALEQEPCEDAISREAVCDALLDYWHDIQFVDDSGYDVYKDCKAVIDELPPVKPQEQKAEKVIKMREATPEERESIDKYIKSISKLTGVDFWDLKQEPCDEAISRQAVLNTLDTADKYLDEDRTVERYKVILTDAYEVLPSVKPQEPKTGHWHIVSDGYGDNAHICECSECNDTVWVYKDADRKWNYCPNCGAKMEG